jgi:hypothetical protein
VQIKRPDPHPPEHHDSNGQPVELQEDGQLVSGPAACPFCVQPEFGVTYEPPPFRRGLTYTNQAPNAASAMSSTTSLGAGLGSPPGRRRGTSLSANDRSVITTDQVRPDWARKLADARAHALRRAAAATALHNAAYMVGNLESSGSRGFGLGRRRRTLFGNESTVSSGSGTPRREGDVSALLAAAAAGGSSSRNEGQNDLTPGRLSSRRANRLEDLEELMMMEAIRLSLAAEEERKKKEDKEAAKEAKKEEKKKAKEAKKAEKTSRRSSFFPSSSPERGEGTQPESSSVGGKGKAVDRSGDALAVNPLHEPTPTANPLSSKENPQRHLEHSRAQIQRETLSNGNLPPFDPFQSPHRAALRNISNASSSVSSLAESLQGSLQHDPLGELGASGSSFGPSPNGSGISLPQDETPPHGTPGTEPMFNFSSLEAVITGEKKNEDDDVQYIENVGSSNRNSEGSLDQADRDVGVGASSSTQNPEIAVHSPAHVYDHEDPAASRSEPGEALEGSVLTITPQTSSIEESKAESVPELEIVTDAHADGNLDTKYIGDVSLMDSRNHQHTQ